MAVKFGPYTVRLGPKLRADYWCDPPKFYIALLIAIMSTSLVSFVFWLGIKAYSAPVDTFIPKGCHCVKCLNLDCTENICCDFVISNTGSH